MFNDRTAGRRTRTSGACASQFTTSQLTTVTVTELQYCSGMCVNPEFSALLSNLYHDLYCMCNTVRS